MKNVLLAMAPVMGLLKDAGEGIKTGVLAGITHYACQQLQTPMKFTFTCCDGEESSEGCRVSHSCCRRAPGSTGCLFSYPCCAGGPQV